MKVASCPENKTTGHAHFVVRSYRMRRGKMRICCDLAGNGAGPYYHTPEEAEAVARKLGPCDHGKGPADEVRVVEWDFNSSRPM